MVKDAAICCRLGVVELVDHHDVEGCGIKRVEVHAAQGLHGREDVAMLGRVFAADQEFAEVGVVEHVGVGTAGLLQDFLAVGHEQQRERAGLVAT